MPPLSRPNATTTQTALHSIALFEAVKGVAALAASLGALSLAHHDIRALAYALIGHFHLNPEAHYPRIFLDQASWLADTDLRQVVLLLWTYAAIRLVEGYGLWRGRAWAEWLEAVSGSIYLPIEWSHWVGHPTVINALILVFNALVVGYMVFRLRQRRRLRQRHWA